MERNSKSLLRSMAMDTWIAVLEEEATLPPPAVLSLAPSPELSVLLPSWGTGNSVIIDHIYHIT